MLVNVFKRLLLVLLAIVMLASVADAALVGDKGKKTADDSLERELDGGIKIECKGVKRNNNSLYVAYTVTTEDDVEVNIGAITIYDNKGNEFNSIRFIEIGNKETSNVSFSRTIISEVPTAVFVGYSVNSDYKLADVYPRVALTVNGKEVRFRNVPGVQ
ncbi:hypothetical protein AGMMS50276_04050 [Synergistales bacterium]|nr:hypothetical protein AGMMS50276_04050 [Synergistales bacterium]